MKTKLIFPALIFIFLFSCKKENDLKDNYQNTFFCNVDGKPFFDDSNLIFEVQGFYSNTTLRGTVTGIVKKEYKGDQPKTLTLKTIGLSIREWKTGRQDLKSAKYTIYDDPCGENGLDKDEFQNLRITHLDTENKIIKGVFNFSTVNICDKSEKHHISFGEFDVKYKVVN
jgi:hypothetical protein